MPDRARGYVAHVVPGRIRLRVDRDALTEPFVSTLRSALVMMPEVDEVRVQPRTGSVTIYHEPDTFGVEPLAERLATQNLMNLDPVNGDLYGRHQPLSTTAEGIHRTFHEVDVRLSELTSRRWDLRTVVPFGLGALALRALIADAGALGAAPWYVLAWYAFDSFWKLNQRHETVSEADDNLEAK
jgi:Heavy metal associated domain 2